MHKAFENVIYEAHTKYPLFYLINLHHLDESKGIEREECREHFGSDLGKIAKAAVKLNKKWKGEAIESLKVAYSDFVKMRMTRLDLQDNKIDELVRNDDMVILPRLPSEKELLYEFIEIFNHPQLFNDYEKYKTDKPLNWFEKLFFNKGDGAQGIRDNHKSKEGDFLGHELKILNVRYFDHRSFYDVNRDNGIQNRYATWQSYMGLNSNQPNKIHRLLVDFIWKHRRKIMSSTNNSSFLVGKFQKAIHDVYIGPIAGIAVVLLVYKLFCVVYHITGKKENSEMYNVEKKILKFVGKGEGIWANDIWCVQHLFNKDGKIISSTTEETRISYDSQNTNPKDNFWFEDLELKGEVNSNESMLERFDSLSWRKVHRLVCICGNAFALERLRTIMYWKFWNKPFLEKHTSLKFIGLFFAMLILFGGIIIISFSSATLAIDTVKFATKDDGEENDEEKDDGGFWSEWRKNEIVWGIRICFFLFFNVALPLKDMCNYGALPMAWHVVQYQYSKWKYKKAEKYKMCSDDNKKNHPYLHKFECKNEGEPHPKGHEKKLPSKWDITFKALGRVLRGKSRDDDNSLVSTGDTWSYYGKRFVWYMVILFVMFFFCIALMLYTTIVIPLKKILLYAYVFLYSDKGDIDGNLGKNLACFVMVMVIAFCSWLLHDVMKYNNVDMLTFDNDGEGADNKNVKLWENYMVSNYPEQKAHIDRHRFAALFASFKYYQQNTDSDSGRTVLGPFVWLFFVVAFYGLMFLIKKVGTMSLFLKLGETEQKIKTGFGPNKKWFSKKLILYGGGVVVIFALVLSIWAMEYYGVYMRMKSDIEDKVAEERKEFSMKNPEASFI